MASITNELNDLTREQLMNEITKLKYIISQRDSEISELEKTIEEMEDVLIELEEQISDEKWESNDPDDYIESTDTIDVEDEYEDFEDSE